MTDIIISDYSSIIEVVSERITGLAERIRIEEGNWPKISRVYYAAANEGILPRSLESLRLIRRIALSGRTDFNDESTCR